MTEQIQPITYHQSDLTYHWSHQVSAAATWHGTATENQEWTP